MRLTPINGGQGKDGIVYRSGEYALKFQRPNWQESQAGYELSPSAERIKYESELAIFLYTHGISVPVPYGICMAEPPHRAGVQKRTYPAFLMQYIPGETPWPDTLTPLEKALLKQQESKELDKLRNLGVVHNGLIWPNQLWVRETQKLYLIDFVDWELMRGKNPRY